MGTPIQSAKNSAKNFNGLDGPRRHGRIASYSDSSRVDFALTAISSDAIKDNAKAAIDRISSYGGTSIGAGLQDGRDQLVNTGNSNHSWSIVLLSDGKENRSPYVSSILPSIVSTKIKVFSIRARRC